MKTIHRVVLYAAVVAYGLFTWWFLEHVAVAGEQIIAAETAMSKPPVSPVAILRFDGVREGLVVPAWSWLNDNNIWAYASHSHAVETSYTPTLVDASVAVGEWVPDKRVSPRASTALEALFSVAATAGQPLIITSAYRSATDQQELLSHYLSTYGSAWTDQHVARPGDSEHQLGLAVDLSSYSSHCAADFANCHLTPSAAEWLANNAHHYGFILRYPADKVDITGVAHEPWHYRYVGERMAGIIHETGLSFDEIIARLYEERSTR